MYLTFRDFYVLRMRVQSIKDVTDQYASEGHGSKLPPIIASQVDDIHCSVGYNYQNQPELYLTKPYNNHAFKIQSIKINAKVYDSFGLLLQAVSAYVHKEAGLPVANDGIIWY